MTILAVTLTAARALNAQEANPLSAEAQQAYTTVKNDILKSAEKMPEENYGFKPAPRVRTFGQILGHVAEEQYFFCASVKGELKAADTGTYPTFTCANSRDNSDDRSSGGLPKPRPRTGAAPNSRRAMRNVGRTDTSIR